MDLRTKIEVLPIEILKPDEQNARVHPEKQIDQLAGMIGRVGFAGCLLIGEDNTIIAGHARRKAAIKAGLTHLPCLRVAGLSKADVRALSIGDNAAALGARWDFEILADGLQELLEADFEMDFLGFADGEIDMILSDASEASTEDRPETEDEKPAPRWSPVTKLGDTWILGNHAISCADAKDPASVEKIMGGKIAKMAFVDGPYNVKIAGNVSGNGKVKHEDFVEASGEMSRPEFTDFLRLTFENLERHCANGAIVYACIDWRHAYEMIVAGEAVFSELKNICVWDKKRAGLGSFYRSQHEFVMVWKVGDAPHTNTFGLGQNGRSRANLWSYPGVNSFGPDRMSDLEAHPTVKNVALVADAIRDVSHRGDTVLDIFGGSGTTLIAAQKTGRKARLLEIEPRYCDVTIERWQKLTGKRAILEATGRSFEEVEHERAEAWGEAA